MAGGGISRAQAQRAVRDSPQDSVVQPLREGYGPLRVARGAEIAPLAGEREKIFMTGLVAADPGESFLQVAADKILPDDVGNDGTKIAVGVGVFLRIDTF